ncbi:MAG: nitronate monooxygenase [Pseudomonadota bacterium]
MTHSPATHRLLEMLSLDVPIIQAPIGPAATPPLVNAVASAGALGMFAGSALGPERLAQSLSQVAPENIKRCAVNIINAMPGDALIDVALSAGVRTFSFFWGINDALMARVKDAGGTVLQTIGAPSETRPARDAGADVLVAQGWEAGGHVWGETATMALLAPVVAEAGEAPVVAAGGIASAQAMQAALAAGAAGVWMGTRFLASAESGAHPAYKEAVVAASAEDTLHTTLFDVGWPDAPARVLTNSTVKAWQAAGCPDKERRPGAEDVVGHMPDGTPIPRYFVDIPTHETTGNVETMAHYAGQSVSQITNILPAAQIIQHILV